MTKQKTFVITGGAGGIGACLVKALIQMQHQVVYIDINAEGGLNLLKDLNSHLAIFIHRDLSQKSEIEACVQELKENTDHIDVLIHNAITSKGGIFNASYEDFTEVLSVGLVAPFYLTQQVLPLLSSKSSIVNIASTRAFQSQPNTEAYAAAKGGIIALTHALAISLKGKARVNSLSPGWIDTSACDTPLQTKDQMDAEQHPSLRIGTPEDILKAVLYLSDESNDFINGQNITIDGGMSKQMIYHQDDGWQKT